MNIFKIFVSIVSVIIFFSIGLAHKPAYPSFPEAALNCPVISPAQKRSACPSFPEAAVDTYSYQNQKRPALTAHETPLDTAEITEDVDNDLDYANDDMDEEVFTEDVDNDLDYLDDDFDEEIVEVPDPLAKFNRGMYHFNDKLYFWALKPTAQVYRVVVPEPMRVSVRNFFTNLGFPIRFVNCLLQANIDGAGTEISRFTVNSTFGLAGLFDPATRHCNITKQDEDFGQTLGVYGLREGIFINWPVLGPSTLRDSVGMIGDYFLNPISYVQPTEASLGINAGKKVNNTSLRIGDYEALKDAAIDPYISIRDAYIQHRQRKVKEKPSPSLSN